MTRKILAVLLALAMVITLGLTACSNGSADTTTAASPTTTASGEDTTASTSGTTSEAETVDWYCAEDMSSMPDWDEYVMPYLTQYFQDNLNINVNFHFFSYADYGTKFNAALTSGTGIDLMFMYSQVTGFYVWYERNALAPLNDLLDQYAPELVADTPDYAFQAVTINDQIYAMPTIKDLATDIGFLYNETMLDETGLKDEFLNTKFEFAQDYNDIFYKVKAARDAAHPDYADTTLIEEYTTDWAYLKGDRISNGVMTMIPGLGCFDDKTSDQVFNLYSTQEYSDMIALINTWVKDGIMPYDAQNWDKEGVYYKEGQELGQFEWGLMCGEPTKYEDSGWVEQLVHPQYAFTYTLQMHDRMHAISALTTESKQIAAMKLYNCISEDPQISTSIRFGVEGTHWEKETDASGNTRVNFDFEGSRNSDPTKRNYYFWYMAEIGDLTTCYLPNTQQDDFFTIMKQLNNDAKASDNMGFLLQTTNIETEIAAVANVIDQYNVDLMYGMMDDYASRIDEFNADLSANGMDTIITEAQTQLNTWLGK